MYMNMTRHTGYLGKVFICKHMPTGNWFYLAGTSGARDATETACRYLGEGHRAVNVYRGAIEALMIESPLPEIMMFRNGRLYCIVPASALQVGYNVRLYNGQLAGRVTAISEDGRLTVYCGNGVTLSGLKLLPDELVMVYDKLE